MSVRDPVPPGLRHLWAGFLGGCLGGLLVADLKPLLPLILCYLLAGLVSFAVGITLH